MPMEANNTSVNSVKAMIREVQKEDRFHEETHGAINNLPAHRGGSSCFEENTFKGGPSSNMMEKK